MTEPGEKPKDAIQPLLDSYHDLIVTMQAAWIEWKRGEGAEAAMAWIHNTLWGPGLIPDEGAPYENDAQKYHDANKSHPLPRCWCGEPAHIFCDGVAACSDAHVLKPSAPSGATPPEGPRA